MPPRVEPSPGVRRDSQSNPRARRDARTARLCICHKAAKQHTHVIVTAIVTAMGCGQVADSLGKAARFSTVYGGPCEPSRNCVAIDSVFCVMLARQVLRARTHSLLVSNARTGW